MEGPAYPVMYKCGLSALMSFKELWLPMIGS